MHKFDRRTVKVQEKSVAVKGQTLFLVKVKGQGLFFILTTLTKDADQSTVTINVPPSCRVLTPIPYEI